MISAKDYYKQAGVDLKDAKEVENFTSTLCNNNDSSKYTSNFCHHLNLNNKQIITSCCDGVGTKIKFYLQHSLEEGIGIDLVAMNINDLITSGSKPINFLNCFSTSDFNINIFKKVIKGIKIACNICSTQLSGGETAIMPNFFNNKLIDINGFANGIVSQDKLLKPKKNIKPLDLIIGLTSSGIHSNGFSLIHKLIDEAKININSPCGSTNIKSHLLLPTRLYYPIIKNLLYNHNYIKGIAHITGGGIIENLARIMPDFTKAIINKEALPQSPLFNTLAKVLKLPLHKLTSTFNCGIGLILIISPKDKEKLYNILKQDIINYQENFKELKKVELNPFEKTKIIELGMVNQSNNLKPQINIE